MVGVRKQHSAATKAKIAMEALKEVKTMAEIAGDNGVHPIQVGKWKKELISRSCELFEDKRRRRDDRNEDTAALYEQIGRLKMELEWLKKKCEGSR